MLKLNEEDFVGKGCHKLTYLHPDDKKKCVKIIYNKDGITDINRELRYRAYRDKKQLKSAILPSYYGEVTTEKGKGYVFEYVCDYDGKISKTLMDYTNDLDLFEKEVDQLIPLMKQLVECLFKERIITMGITAENIIFQQVSPTEKKLYLITDLGVSEIIPFVLYFDNLAVKKITRKYHTMINHMIQHHDSAPMRKLMDELKNMDIVSLSK